MKRGLKWLLIAVYMTSIGVLTFLPAVRIAWVNMTLNDMVMLSFMQPAKFADLGNMGGLVQTYVRPFGWALLGFWLLAVLFMVCMLRARGKKIYLRAVFCVLALNGYLSGLIYFAIDKFYHIAQGVSFYQLDGGAVICWLPVILWFVLDGVIFVLAACGIYFTSIQEQQTPLFQGALLGADGQYAGLAYPLQSDQAVFICQDDKGIYVSTESSDAYLACIRYDPVYQEYQVKVRAKHTVCLESGQPLGPRLYYLPRGIKICFSEADEALILG